MRAVAAAVAGALVLAACTSGASTSGTSSSDAAPASSPAPVESAEEGDVAWGEPHPKSKCEDADDVTANARIYNNLDVIWLDDKFRARTEIDPTNSDVVWLRQTGEKSWDNNDEEGEHDCAKPPMGVSNLQTYYYWDGKVWGDHPGWWGHQEDFHGADDPSGYVWWKCTAVDRNDDGSVTTGNWNRPCIDSALASAEIKAPWDTRGNEEKDVRNRPSCEVRNSTVVGCWTDSSSSGYEWDFVYDTYAWTAPMRLDLSTSWMLLEQAFVPVSADDTKGKLTDIYLAWKVSEASLTQGAEWVNRTSPQGQILKPGASNGLTVGAYAIADNRKSTMALRLNPAYFTTKEGTALSCARDASKLVCSRVKDGDTPPSVADFFEKAFTINVAASVELQDVRRNGGTPKIKVDKDGKTKADPISCKKSAESLGKATVVLTCEKTGGEAGSAFAYGASWLAAISRT